MDKEELFKRVNEIIEMLDNIYDEILLSYCLQCIDYKGYANDESFELFKEEYE